MKARKLLNVVKLTLVVGIVCWVVGAPAVISSGSIAFAACSSDEHVWLGTWGSVSGTGGTQAAIEVYNDTYCSTSGDMYYYEAVHDGSGLAQAGWGEGAGIGGPHAFDEYFTTTGTTYGPYISSSLSNYDDSTYESIVYYDSGRRTDVGASYRNGSLIDSHALDWFSGTGLEFLGESYSSYNHWNSYYTGDQYCTNSGGSICTPGTSYTSNETYTGDANACWKAPASNSQNMYDKRAVGGKC
jgi:hypothetical protein